MATRRYVNSPDPQELEFGFHTFNGIPYLQFGFLNPSDRLWVNSLLSGTIVGFLTGSRAFTTRLADSNTGLGLPLEEIPSALVLGADYRIRFAQARPGTAGEAGEAQTVVQEQGVVRFSVAADIDVGVEAHLHFDYKVVDAFYERFALRFYPSANDYDLNRPIDISDDAYPENIRIVPPVPFTSQGEYIHELYFTPTYAGQIFISIDLIKVADTGINSYQLLDINENMLLDVRGERLMAAASPMYNLIDVNDQQLVDSNGDRLIGFR